MRGARIIVTNRSRLMAKYRSSYSEVDDAINELVTKSSPAVPTVLIHLDTTEVVQWGGTPVSTWNSESQVKAAIDAVWNGILAVWSPPTMMFLMILGGPDVVPHQSLNNPVHDDDRNVPSDLPYACAAPFSADPGQFVAPNRMVGRLPDVPGDKDGNRFATLIDAVADFTAGTADDYATYFALAAQAWRAEATWTAQMAFGDSSAVHLSPPEGPRWAPPTFAPLCHLYLLHGPPNGTTWKGEDFNGKQPDAITTSAIDGHVDAGTIVASQACFSGQLWASGDLKKMSFANTYLLSGAAMYAGATNNSYGPQDNSPPLIPHYCDALGSAMLFWIRQGYPLGQAFAWSRFWFLHTDHVDLDPIALKSLAQYVMFGDPALIAVGTPITDAELAAAHRRMQLTAAFADRIATTPEEIPDAVRLPAVDTALRDEARRRGLPEPYRVVSYRSVWRGDDDLRPVAGDLPRFHLLHVDRFPDAPDRTPVVLVAREERGEIVSVRAVQQRGGRREQR